MTKSNENAEELLYLCFAGEFLTIVAKQYPRLCEITFKTGAASHVVVLHNPVDAALLGTMLEPDTCFIRIAQAGHNRANGIEGGRFRVGLHDSYDEEIFSTLVDSFEHYSC